MQEFNRDAAVQTVLAIIGSLPMRARMHYPDAIARQIVDAVLLHQVQPDPASTIRVERGETLGEAMRRAYPLRAYDPNPPAFKPGDLVVLRSGGPVMTVSHRPEELRQSDGGVIRAATIRTEWFVSDKIERDGFHEAELLKVSP